MIYELFAIVCIGTLGFYLIIGPGIMYKKYIEPIFDTVFKRVVSLMCCYYIPLSLGLLFLQERGTPNLVQFSLFVGLILLYGGMLEWWLEKKVENKKLLQEWFKSLNLYAVIAYLLFVWLGIFSIRNGFNFEAQLRSSPLFELMVVGISGGIFFLGCFIKKYYVASLLLFLSALSATSLFLWVYVVAGI